MGYASPIKTGSRKTLQGANGKRFVGQLNMNEDILGGNDLLACFSSMPNNGSPGTTGPRAVALAVWNLKPNDLKLGVPQETLNRAHMNAAP